MSEDEIYSCWLYRDCMEATRRAIVRAAAEIGRATTTDTEKN